MTVVSVKPYEFEPKDTLANFRGNQLVFVLWERHLMFGSPAAFPLNPNMKFGDLINGVLLGVYGAHPDWRQIDWTIASWTKSGEVWNPDFERSLTENGVSHKDVLCFQTLNLHEIGDRIN